MEWGTPMALEVAGIPEEPQLNALGLAVCPPPADPPNSSMVIVTPPPPFFSGIKGQVKGERSREVSHDGFIECQALPGVPMTLRASGET